MAFSATLSHLSTISSSLPLPSRSFHLRRLSQFRVKAEAEKDKQSTQAKSDGEASPASTKTPKTLPKKPYLSVGHPPFYKGLDYIYEDRGEVGWVGIPTAPAWLPTDMLIKVRIIYEHINKK
ncbi:hypothetical protein Bca4012_057881 [Brassica carinata]